jgi:hypothetical protein
MSQSDRCDRRSFLGNSLATLGATGAALGAQHAAAAAPEGQKPAAPAATTEAADALPYGMLGKAKISRLLLGGNLVTGCMHSRDLHYVSPLFRAYMTEEKILQTMKLAEENGINTVLESGAAFVLRYNKQYGGHMQFIPSIHPTLTDDTQRVKDEVKQQVDLGAAAIYVWGVAADGLVRAGAIDKIAKAVEYVKAQGLAAGVGGHSLNVPMECEKQKVPCDFYVKTFHTDEYPSATPKELRKEYIWLDGGKGWNDNMWCINPEETSKFMQTVTKPWIAFKILAAGAIDPRKAFSYSFRNGADFIGVGMFDFQIKEDRELAVQMVRRNRQRQRPWYG